MLVSALEQMYAEATCSDNVATYLRFTKALLESDEPEIISYHWELLRDTSNIKLYHHMRAAFARRGKHVEEFLLERLQDDPEQRMRADALQLLGMLKSDYARQSALAFLQHEHPDDRYRGCIVLGWVGFRQDIEAMELMLSSDPVSKNRGYAATAMRQIFWRFPELADEVLPHLETALMREDDLETQKLLLISLQSILKKNFGIKEDLEEHAIRGDVPRAKEKALRALARRNRR